MALKITPISKDVILNLTAKTSEVEKSIERVLQNIKGVGLSDAFTKKLTPSLQKLLDKSQELRKEIETTDRANSKTTQTWSKSYEKIVSEVTKLIAKMETKISFKDLTGYDKAKFDALKKDLDSVKKKRDDLYSSKKIQAQQELIAPSITGGRKSLQESVIRNLQDEGKINNIFQERKVILDTEHSIKAKELSLINEQITEYDKLINLAKELESIEKSKIDYRTKTGRQVKSLGITTTDPQAAAKNIKDIASKIDISSLTEQQGKTTEGIGKFNLQLQELSSYKAQVLAFMNQFTSEVQQLDEPILKASLALAQFEQETLDMTHANLNQTKQDLAGVATNANKLAIETDKVTENLLDMEQKQTFFKDMQLKIAQIFGLANAFQMLRRFTNEAWRSIQNLDKAFTEIAVVTEYSVEDLWNTFETYNKMAQQLGVRTTDAIATSALYYQQGLDTKDVMTLTVQTIKMARIAGMDFAAATQAMTSAIRGFKLEMQDAQLVTDTYSALAAAAAVDTQQLAVAMSKTASIAGSAGMAFESTSAYLTQIIETTQEAPETAGTALKTIIARFTELTKNPLSLNLEVEGEEVNANKIEAALRLAEVDLRNTEGQFRDLDTVFLELSGKWDSLDRNTQRYIATIAAGSRQQSRFIAMMDNNKRTVELMGVAYDAAGAGNLQFSKTLESIDSKMNKLKSSFEAIVGSLAKNKSVKNLLDLLNNGMTILASLAEKGIGQFSIFIITMGVVIKNALSAVIGLFSFTAKKWDEVRTNIGRPIDVVLQLNTQQAILEYNKFRTLIGQQPIVVPMQELQTVVKPGDPNFIGPMPKKNNTIARSMAGPIVSSLLTSLVIGLTTGNFKSALTIGLTTIVSGAISTALRSEAIVSAIKAFGVRASAALLPLLASPVGIGIAITAGAVIIGKLLYDYNNQLARTKRELKELTNQYDELTEKAAESQAKFLGEQDKLKTIRELVSEYKELNSLEIKSVEQQERFSEVSSKIAEKFPEIVIGYDDVGNALFKQNESWDLIIKKQEESLALTKEQYSLEALRQSLINEKIVGKKVEVAQARINKGGTSTKDIEELEEARKILEGADGAIAAANLQVQKVIKELASIEVNIKVKETGKNVSKEVSQIGQDYIVQRTKKVQEELKKLSQIDTRDNRHLTIGETLPIGETFEDLPKEIQESFGLIKIGANTTIEEIKNNSDKLLVNFVSEFSKGMFADLEILETQYGARLTEIVSNTNKTTQEEFKQNLTNLLGENNKFLNTLISQFQLASKELDNFLFNEYGKTKGNQLIEAYGRSQIQNLINIFGKEAPKAISYISDNSITPLADEIFLSGDPSSVDTAQQMIVSLVNKVGLSYADAKDKVLAYADAMNFEKTVNKETIANYSILNNVLKNTNTITKYKKALTNLQGGLVVKEDIEDLIKDVPEASGIFRQLADGTIDAAEAAVLLEKALQSQTFQETQEKIIEINEALKENSISSIEVQKALAELGITSDQWTQNQSLFQAYLAGNTQAFWDLNDAQWAAIISAESLNGIDLTNWGQQISSKTGIAIGQIQALTRSMIDYATVLERLGMGTIEKEKVVIGYERGDAGMWTPIEEEISYFKYNQTKGTQPISKFSGSAGKKSSKEKYEIKVDPNDSFIRQIKDINTELDRLEQDRENILTSEDYQKSINKTIKFLQERQKLYEEYNKKLLIDRDKLSKEINDKKYSGASVQDGELVLDRNKILKLNEKQQEALDELINKWDDIDSKINDNTKSLEENTKEYEQIKEAARDAYLDLEQKIIDILVDQAEKEIKLQKEKYDDLKKADENYLNALRKNINKRRAARDKENAYDDLEKKEKRLALLKRDTSGIYAVEVLALEEELAQTRQELADQAIDDELTKLEENNTAKAEKYDQDVKNLEDRHDDRLKDMKYFNDEANKIMQLGSTEILNWLEKNDNEFLTSTQTAQQKYLETWQTTVAQAKTLNNGALANTTVTNDKIVESNKLSQTTRDWLNNEIAFTTQMKATDPDEGKRKWANDMLYLYNLVAGSDKGASDWAIEELKRRGIKVPGYSEGGLVDFTGLAAVHGSTSAPEAFLSAADTKNFKVLTSILSGLLTNNSNYGVGDQISNSKYGDCYIEVSVGSIANDYDVDQAINKVKQSIVESSNYRNVNLISRKR